MKMMSRDVETMPLMRDPRQTVYEMAAKVGRKLGIVRSTTREHELQRCFEKELDNTGGHSKIEGGDICSLWKHPNFKRTDEKRILLLESKNPWALRALIKDKQTPSEILKKVFDKMLLREDVYPYIQELFAHPNFQMKEEEKRKKMSKAEDVRMRLDVVKDRETSNTILNEMLCAEVMRIKKELNKQKKMSGWPVQWSQMFIFRYMELVEEIKKHPNFQPQDATKDSLKQFEKIKETQKRTLK